MATRVPPPTSMAAENEAAYKGTPPLATKDLEPEACGAELSTGGTCDRPATECPYHQD